MSDCCTPRGYERLFSERGARAAARRYRAKGLDITSRRILALLRRRDLSGDTLLEIGGGIGDLQIELLRAGMERSMSVELTPTYESAASDLLRETGLSDRVERRVVDFVDASAGVAPADVVVLNRVVCCYPDMPRLTGAAADHTRGVLVMSFPKRTWWTRLLLAAGNLMLRVARREFRVFLHRPEEIARVARRHGLHALVSRRGMFWEIAAWERDVALAARSG